MNELYQADIKERFLHNMIELKKSYICAYKSLFNLSKYTEKLFGKDLSQFNSKELFSFYKGNARDLKYTTVLSYNSLIRDYKEWAKNHVNENVNMEICTVNQLNKITNYKQYIVFTDETLDKITKYAVMDGGAYNSLIFIRLFWEVNGQVSANTLCTLNVDNIDFENQTIKFDGDSNSSYKVSKWLIDTIEDFTNIERISFTGRNGNYYIGTAEENNGYLFRMTRSKKTKNEIIGRPINAIKMSNILNHYSANNLDETITINDLLMSLALKDMIFNVKTFEEINKEKRYFKNMPSAIYREILNTYAKELYSDEYEQYIKIIS